MATSDIAAIVEALARKLRPQPKADLDSWARIAASRRERSRIERGEPDRETWARSRYGR